jgi:hypothetical protein
MGSFPIIGTTTPARQNQFGLKVLSGRLALEGAGSTNVSRVRLHKGKRWSGIERERSKPTPNAIGIEEVTDSKRNFSNRPDEF